MVDETILMLERLSLTLGQMTRRQMALVMREVPMQSVGYQTVCVCVVCA
jgi:hypothetical protein